MYFIFNTTSPSRPVIEKETGLSSLAAGGDWRIAAADLSASGARRLLLVALLRQPKLGQVKLALLWQHSALRWSAPAAPFPGQTVRTGLSAHH